MLPIWGNGPGMGVGRQNFDQRRAGAGRLREALQDKADGDGGYAQDDPAQKSSPIQRVLHFNSDGTKLQEECTAREFRRISGLEKGIGGGTRIILSLCCRMGGY
jgi:hypothetical protein